MLPKPEEVPKNQSLEVKILPKPEEVPKKRKTEFQKSWGLETSRTLFFLVPPQVLAIFFLKTLPKPEEVPKNQSSGGLQAPRLLELWFFFCLFGTSSGFGKKGFVFFGTSSGFGTILLPKLEERKIHPKIRSPEMKDFSLISNEILEGSHTKENPSKNEKSRNEGFLFNFQ